MSEDPIRELFSTQSGDSGDPNVLIVEDEESLRELLAFRLESDFSVETAADGDECLQYLEADDTPVPDVITLDLMLPRRDGYQVLKEIRATPRFLDIDVIVISGLSQDVSAMKALDLGASDYLRKPISARELATRIERLV